jgi:hypothetical protein
MKFFYTGLVLTVFEPFFLFRSGVKKYHATSPLLAVAAGLMNPSAVELPGFYSWHEKPMQESSISVGCDRTIGSPTVAMAVVDFLVAVFGEEGGFLGFFDSLIL